MTFGDRWRNSTNEELSQLIVTFITDILDALNYSYTQENIENLLSGANEYFNTEEKYED